MPRRSRRELRIRVAGGTCSSRRGGALGAQAGEARLREMVLAAGFRSIRRAAETPFNIILDARA